MSETSSDVERALSLVIAKQTYFNATVEKLKLLTLLQEHERNRNQEEITIRAFLDERLTVSDALATLTEDHERRRGHPY